MRRACDIFFALSALILLSPFLFAIGIALLLASPSRPFYRGVRIGRFGKPFRMWKFRTMVPGAARFGSITAKNDGRVTPIGRFLRRTKLDELPQLFNLLKGDMTLIGPRPEAPDVVALYTAEQSLVLTVKPGLTGISQIRISDESESIPPHVNPTEYYVEHIMGPKNRADLDYLRSRSSLTRSLKQDARILIATFRLVGRSLTRTDSEGRLAAEARPESAR